MDRGGKKCSGVHIYCVGDGKSRRRGAARSWRQTYVDGLTQDGGAIWRRGGTDGKPDKVIVLIAPKDGMAEDDASNF